VAEHAASHPHIDFVGRQDRAGVRSWMQQAQILVAPSQEAGGAREAAGLVLLEAQACGTPVLAYRSGGIPEMMEDGVTGVLAPEADFRQLQDGLQQLLQLGSAEYLAMRRDARKFVVDRRSLAGSVRELDGHYQDLAAQAPTPKRP
jgi:glycosyltransferase involved in cell wall biosynthesis